MRVMEDKTETVHIYVVREEERPSLLPIFLSVIALLALAVVCTLFPYQQPEIREAIRVPAVLLPLQTFTTSLQVIPTGIKTYPATTAHGILTLTNGSVVSSELPKGLLFSGNGIEVVTNSDVFVPAGSASGYGYATVSAHALMSGKQGNISAYAINTVEGTSIYIRNLKDFTGGMDSYSVTVVTAQDTQKAIEKARNLLIQHTLTGLLENPCKEIIRVSVTSVAMRWRCQFVTYETPHLPQVKVLHATVQGRSVLLDVVYGERPQISLK